MCGNCHTINLPLMDNPSLNAGLPHLEQLTYLEWLNSGYQHEIGNNPRAQTCQDCHMATKYSNSKGTLSVPLIQQPIAFIEDDQYPQTGNRLPADKIRVRFREKGFARHQLQDHAGLAVLPASQHDAVVGPVHAVGPRRASGPRGAGQGLWIGRFSSAASRTYRFCARLWQRRARPLGRWVLASCRRGRARRALRPAAVRSVWACGAKNRRRIGSTNDAPQPARDRLCGGRSRVGDRHGPR